MQKTFSEETYLTIILSTILLLLFGGLMVYYFFHHQKKRFLHDQEVSALRESFNQIILQSKLEIQELTLDQISKELHANFSHLVSLININLAAALPASNGEVEKHIMEAKQLAKQLMADLKILSVSLNSDYTMKIGFYKALENELNRLERTGKYEVKFNKLGISARLPPEKEIILFRLCQEILNNVVRHAKATTVTVTLIHSANCLSVTIADNGMGFDPEEAKQKSIEKSSTGLLNIAGRAKLIQAELKIESDVGKGTVVKVSIPLLEEKKETNGN
jgi:signal transduction histidine kinase